MRFTLCTLALLVVTLCLMINTCKAEPKSDLMPEEKQDIFYKDRLNMVTNQIERRGVTDKLVLEAMRSVPRHKFVSESQQLRAYEDNPLSIGHQQTISQPYIVALMTGLLKLKGGERVLEIGTGSGYQAAVLAKICDSVYTIEIICALAERAERVLNELHYDNIKVICGDGYRGYKEAAPFDCVIVTAAPESVPGPLLDQLKVGGRLVIPVGKHYQYLKVFEKTESGIKEHTDIPVRFVPMTGEAEDN
jgi:protein-L-isoaspartate(D-aspartate) O-methyltransferase